MHSPIALGVFSASFLVVLAALLVISAQPTILKLVLFFYAASPFSRWAMTQGWQRRLILWYKSRRAARVCVWIKDDDVCLVKRYCSSYCCPYIPLSRFTSCYEHCSQCRGTSRMLEQLYLSTHTEILMPYQASYIQMPASSMKHSLRSRLSKCDHEPKSSFCAGLIRFSLAFAPGNFGPVVSPLLVTGSVSSGHTDLPNTARRGDISHT